MTYRVGEAVVLTPKDSGPLTLAVTAPDGTVTTTGPAVGPQTIITTQAGDYVYVFSATGVVEEDQFHVIASVLRIVGLTEVKEHGNITSTAADRELLDFIGTAQQMIEDLVGITVPQTFTETHYASDRYLWLHQRPVLAVTQVIEYGSAVTPSLYNIDPDDGTVVRVDGRNWYGAATSALTVTYRAGRSPIPEAIRWAAKELTISLWRSTQAQRGGRGRGETPDTPTGYALPNRVRESLEPFLLPPVLA